MEARRFVLKQIWCSKRGKALRCCHERYELRPYVVDWFRQSELLCRSPSINRNRLSCDVARALRG